MTGSRRTASLGWLSSLASWTTAPSEPMPRREIWVALALMLTAVVLVGSRVSGQPVDPDELGHLHSAWLWHQGLAPYVDFFEHHPPLYWFVLRPVVALNEPHNLHGAIWAGRTLSFAIVVGTFAATAAAARELLGSSRAGLYTATAWALFCTLSDRIVHIRPDQLMLLLLLCGTYLAARGTAFGKLARPDRKARAGRVKANADRSGPPRGVNLRLAAAGGALLGCAVCANTKAIFWVIPFTLAVAVGLLPRERRTTAHWRAAAAFVAGGALVALAMVGWIVLFNDWGAFWYSNLSRNQPLVGGLVRRGAWWRVLSTGPFSWPLPHVAAAALGLVLLVVHRKPTQRWVAIVLGVLGGAGLIVLGLSRWHHYHYPLLWWMTLLVGFAFAAVTAKLSGRAKLAGALFIALPAFFDLHSRRTEIRSGALDASLAPYEQVLARRQPEDTMVALAHRNAVFVNNATPSLWMSRMIGQDVERDRVFVDALEQHQPRFIFLAPYRPLRIPHGRVFRHYDRLNDRVLERRPEGAPRPVRPLWRRPRSAPPGHSASPN